MKTIPDILIYKDHSYFTDGGTIELDMRDKKGNAHSLVLAQHEFIEDEDCLNEDYPNEYESCFCEHADGEVTKWGAWYPGRLYFDNTLIPIRSAEETTLIRLVEKALQEFKANPPALAPGAQPEYQMEAVIMMDAFLDFLRSQEYVNLAGQM